VSESTESLKQRLCSDYGTSAKSGLKFAEKKRTNVPRNNAEKLAGNDWFSNFKQRNTQLFLRKPEDLYNRKQKKKH
jgi:hypothetical protein